MTVTFFRGGGGRKTPTPAVCKFKITRLGGKSRRKRYPKTKQAAVWIS